MTTNFDLFLQTVNTLKSSQGFYSRLSAQIDEWTEDERARSEKQFNSLPQFKDSVDVVL